MHRLKFLWNSYFFTFRPLSNAYPVRLHIEAREIEGSLRQVTSRCAFEERPRLVWPPITESRVMMDVLLTGAVLAFFAFCVVYTRACERL